MTNNQRSAQDRWRPFERWSGRMVAPLLAFALTHCGGTVQNGQSLAGGSSNGGANAQTAAGGAGSGGQAGLSLPGMLIPSDAATGTPNCNELRDSAPFVRPSVGVGNPPTPQGGLIANGVYYLSKREDFLGAGAGSRLHLDDTEATLVISGSTEGGAELQLRWMEISGELPIPVSLTETLAVTGTSFMYTVTCGSSLVPAGPISFTATPSELLWIYPDPSGGTLVDTFQRK